MAKQMAEADKSGLNPSIIKLHGLRSGAFSIASAPLEMRDSFLDELSDNALASLPYLFEFWAHDHQIPPDGNWRTWVILGGRGAGKTRAGSEWVRAEVEGASPFEAGRSRRVALVGETLEQVRNVMVFGDSGILASSPPDCRPIWEETRRKLVWPNGAEAQVFSAHDPERLRGPQFDAAWCDEIGCAAIDKGTNQPNKFLDPKSSESSLPKYSTGARDDVIQMQYLRAIFEYWNDPGINPEAALFGGRMVDMSRTFVWAWDARPYPFFPGNRELWSDGDNYARGHWLNGRVGARALAEVVREICAEGGVEALDTSRLYGAVKGYSVAGGEEPRSALQPLMLAYGFDATEREGQLVFRTRDGRHTAIVDDDTMALGAEGAEPISLVRSPEAEVSGRVRLTFVEADGDYEARAVETAFPDENNSTVSQTEMPLVLTQAEGLEIVERWLADARIARDQVQLSLPPSLLGLGAGDVIEIDHSSGTGSYRIDRVEQGNAQRIEAVRVETGTNIPSLAIEADVAPRGFAPALPVEAVFLDLPLLSGDEAPHAPAVAAIADPWPGDVAVYRSATGSDFQIDTILQSAAAIGVTENPLDPSVSGLIDRGTPLKVRMAAELQSITEDALLAGGNRCAIGMPGSDDWEIFQFQSADLIAPGLWELSFRLRGQAGTEPFAQLGWAAGATVVLLTAAVQDSELPTALRGVSQTWRVGPASRDVSDVSYVESSRAFSGVGLRPYSPVHLRGQGEGSGGVDLSWIRRTRIDGDNWSGLDVPLGEASELYLLRFVVGGSIRREITTAQPEFTYTAAHRAEDGAVPTFDIEVAQVSDRFGPGPFTRMTWND